MSRGIPLSKKHGLNPTIPICFFCGKEKNEVALLGKLKGDVEAPRNIILDYEPCDACKAIMEGNVTLIGVSNTGQKGQMPIQKQGDTNLYPTGHFMVVKPHVIDHIMEPEMAENVKNYGKCLLEDKVLHEIQKMFDNMSKDTDDKEESVEEE